MGCCFFVFGFHAFKWASLLPVKIRGKMSHKNVEPANGTSNSPFLAKGSSSSSCSLRMSMLISIL